jgi:hypothetical protein
MTCVILQDDTESVKDQPRAAKHQPHVAERSSGLGEDLSGYESESTEDLSTQVPPRRRTKRVSTSLLIRSPQIQSLDRLLDQSVIGNQFLYSQSAMIINANANSFTNLYSSQWGDTTFEGIGHRR